MLEDSRVPKKDARQTSHYLMQKKVRPPHESIVKILQRAFRV